ncbi:MAG: hypothetical protein CSA21_00465 [Deltaproteobacteria bacterium]|nr:MAG: hypothetical protein CSA21_00465 [Deltaproteobacteria bacterium]
MEKRQQLRQQLQKSIIITLLLLTGLCSTSIAAGEEEHRLTVALLPLPDVLPVYVALENGYFSSEGITVQPLSVGSAVERDQLLQAGKIDAMINEISGAALFNRNSVQMQIVSYARIPEEGVPLFRLLASPESGITKVADLAGVPIGVSKNTVIEYVTEKMLIRGGLAAEQIVSRSVPVLPERLQLLLSGQLKAATLPEPLASSALHAGAVEVINDLALPGLSASVVSFSRQAIEKKSGAVRQFMKAWDRAAADLNATPENYRALMLKKIRVPKNVQDSYPIPRFPRGKNVTREQWHDTVAWLLEKKLLKKTVSFDDAVSMDFLPR